MSVKERPTLKALNIVRPSSPFPLQDASHSSSTASNSTLSTLSNNSFTKVQPTILSPANFAYFQNNWSTFKTNPIGNTVGVNPHRFLQRPRSNSNLSRATFMSNHSILSDKTNNDDNDDEEDEEGDYEENDLDTIDGLTDDELDNNNDEEEDEDDDSDIEDNADSDEYEDDNYEEEDDDDDDDDEEVLPTKIVAKIKHGTIMNGKGEFVNKGTVEDQPLDEARANRKIADLEIEKASLLALNMTLEAKLKVQATQIADLQKRLQVNDGPLTPVFDKHVDEPLLFDSPIDTEEEILEQDQVFQRICSMLEGLIKQAEEALIQKSKASGKVLQDYNPNEIKIEDVQTKTKPLTRLKSKASSPDMRRPRQMSDTTERPQPKPSIANNTRNSSRQSSPPILVTSPTSPRSPSPRLSPPANNSRTLRNMRKSQEFEKPKWHF